MKNYLETLNKTRTAVEQEFKNDEKRMEDQRAELNKQLSEVNKSLTELDQAKKKAIRTSDQKSYISASEQERQKLDEREYVSFCLEAISSTFTDDDLILKYNDIAKGFDSQMKDLLKEYQKQKSDLAMKYIEMIRIQDAFLTIRRMFSDRMERTPENSDAPFEYGVYNSYGKRFMRTVSFPANMDDQDEFFKDELLKNGLDSHSGNMVLSKRHCIEDFSK